MSRWLIVGEGPSEIGSAGRFGFLECLLRQLADDGSEVLAQALDCGMWDPVYLPEIKVIAAQALPKSFRHELRAPQPKGMGRVSALAVLAAQALQCDAVVVLVDNDGKPNRRAELADGLGDTHLPAACGVAKEMLEAWLLADPGAFTEPPEVDRRPEDLWGQKDDPDSRYPKCVFRRALAQSRMKRHDVLDRWRIERAAPRAPWLCDFCRALLRLLCDRALCRPRAWDE